MCKCFSVHKFSVCKNLCVQKLSMCRRCVCVYVKTSVCKSYLCKKKPSECERFLCVKAFACKSFLRVKLLCVQKFSV